MNEQLRELIFNGVEGAISMAVTGTTKKGIECVAAMAVNNIVGDNKLKPDYDKAISRTIKIAAAVAGRKLASMYAEDIMSIVKGAYYGYTAGKAVADMSKMAKGCDISGGESEVLDGGSEEE